MGKQSFCLTTKNHRGTIVLFSEENRQRHLEKHPELRNKSFLQEIETTVGSPEEIWEDLRDEDIHCYYKIAHYERRGYGRMWHKVPIYVKVVIKTRILRYLILTAYYIPHIKEAGETRRIYKYKNKKNEKY
jgi:hypothetical protein